MKRAITFASVCLGIAAIAAPAATADTGGTPNGGRSAIAKECAKLKKADRAAFKATFGKHAMRKCIKGEPVATSETTPAEFKNAAKECLSERETDPVAFQETYGTNENKKNAYGKCVSKTAKASTEEAAEDRVNAAQTCKALKRDDADAFEDDYGSRKNAFGKCVSATARADDS